MAREDRILAIDIGATSIKLCEFDFSNATGINLSRFSHREYEEELSDATRIGVVAGLLRQMLAEGGYQAKKALVCMSGQSALTRFSRLPTVNVDRKRIRQLAEFEATQNIPFAISEVLWDYQLISNASGDSVDVMSVVIKNDIVEQFTGAISQVGCQPILIDVAPAACYNACRACGIGENEGCEIVLNIGGRVTNLLFIEGERIYVRTIPIAGYTITQQIAKEFGIGLPEAEELKRHHGFVALGGAYAEPESETAANVSKIIRNVMSRLLGETTRTINVYRAQQKGSKPSKMYITGGSSILTYCDTFFSEKLNIPVEYFNPFKCVNLLPTVDKQKLVEVGHMFSETIGLGLRYAQQCPVELSLIPANIRRQQDFDRKKPFFIMAFVCILIMLLVILFGISSRTDSYDDYAKRLNTIVNNDAKRYIDPIEQAIAKTNDSKSQIEVISELLLQQAKWPSIINEIYRIKPDNIWITSLTPIIGEVAPIEQKSSAEAAAETAGGPDMFGGGGAGADMFGGPPAGGMMDGPGAGGGFGGGAAAGPTANAVTIGGIQITGTSVIPNKDGVTFTLGKPFEFPFKVEASSESSESDDNDDAEKEENAEQEEKDDEKESSASAEKRMAKAMKEAGSTPEEAFLAALRASDIIDSEPTLTVMTYYKAADYPKNYTNFRIQIKFNMPVEFYQITGRVSGNGNDMMGPGERR